MHAVVVNLTINDPKAAEMALHEQLVRRVSQAPGFITGYWTTKGGSALSMFASYVASAPQKRCRVWLKPPLVKARTFAGRTANTRAVPTSCRKPS